uniref:Uncharacterized protein n=1 Tax=Panagrolaimus sp. ES5 TaxID=591445 RepID=A0AC34GHZ9_9BILA
NVNRSVTDHINNLIADYTSSDISNRGNQKELIATEALLIQLAFSPVPSTFNEPFLNETIISYPSFVISVPSFYSEDFKSNFQRLKDICGVQDVAVRLRKTKGNFHHFTVACEGTLESCIKVEEKLTPYLPYEFSSLSFMQMRRRKTRAMQDILEDVFGFTPPPLSLHHSQTTPARLNAPNQIGYCNENQQNNIDPRFGNENHERHATV